jgi:hypothetical protein
MVCLDHRADDAVRVGQGGRDVERERSDPFRVDLEDADDEIGSRFWLEQEKSAETGEGESGVSRCIERG